MAQPCRFWRGGGNALWIIVERAIKNKTWYRKTPGIIKWSFTIILIYSGWIIFSADDMDILYQNFEGLFIPAFEGTINFTWRYYLSARIMLLLIIASVGQIFGLPIINSKIKNIISKPEAAIAKKIVLILLFVVSVMFFIISRIMLGMPINIQKH